MGISLISDQTSFLYGLCIHGKFVIPEPTRLSLKDFAKESGNSQARCEAGTPPLIRSREGEGGREREGIFNLENSAPSSFFFGRLSKITSLWVQEKNPSKKRLSRAAKKKTWEENHSLKLTHKLKRSQVKQPASEPTQKPSHLQDSTPTKQWRA